MDGTRYTRWEAGLVESLVEAAAAEAHTSPEALVMEQNSERPHQQITDVMGENTEGRPKRKKRGEKRALSAGTQEELAQ